MTGADEGGPQPRYPVCPHRAGWRDAVVLGFGLAQALTGALHEWVTSVTEIAAGNANWHADQNDFADDVRMGLESLPEAGEE